MICRKHGLRCRVQFRSHRDSYLIVYREDSTFEEKWRTVKQETQEQGIEFTNIVHNTI